jgi:hypothetical protein
MTLMEQLQQIIDSRKDSIDYSNRNKTLTSIDYRSIDRVMDSYPQLVTEAYRGWHANKIKQIGVDKYTQLADRALKYGTSPQKLFSKLLKEY